MQLFDTHCHVNLRAFNIDKNEVLNRALENNVAVANVGTQLDTSKEAVRLVSEYADNVYAVIGLHPVHTFAHDYLDENESGFKTREEIFDFETYKSLATHPKVVGIGECGLDYYRLPEDANHDEIKSKQRNAFAKQIDLAIEMDKALCIHCRPSPDSNDAYEEIIEMLIKVKERAPGLRFEIHCFTGDALIAKKFVDLGGYIGLNGIITFDKSGIMEEVIKTVPLESIVLETDAPYLTPVPYRGKRNEPTYIIEVAKKIAETKGVSLDEVASQTSENAERLFKLTSK